MKNNVTIQDIKDLTIEYGILLSDNQYNNILEQFNRTVMDKAGDWKDILKELFIIEITK